VSPWLQAIRPATLPVGVVPVMVGAAAAWASTGRLEIVAVLLALAATLCLQIGTNLVNDVFDADKGADTAARLGPIRVTQAGLLPARTVRRAAFASFATAVVAGAALAAVAGWPVVVIGVASIAAGVLYTAGPWPLGYHGLGEVAVMLFFGLLAVVGTAWVGSAELPALAFGLAVPVGALATAVLVVNNLRDRATDAQAGKRTGGSCAR
jgi:1,4-dihydroxy-2-naphthoate octaprenyltransferase